jgi:hypothetical protein
MLELSKRRQLTKVGHIGNVDANSICPIFVGLDRQRVVEIFRRRRVDSEDPLASEILSDLVLSFRNAIAIRQLTRIDRLTRSSPPWKWGQAFEGDFGEFLRGKVAVFQQGARLNFTISNRSELLDQRSKRM